MYVKSETVEKMQSVVYEILTEIDAFCSKNGITYFLSGGTCLGAVRHHGFIPWDDDGDIMMPREDYEKFIQSFGDGTSSRFKITTLDNNKKCNLPYARVWDPNTRVIHKTIDAPEIGVSVDVFPIDGVSKHKFLRKIYYWRLKVLDALCSEAIRKKYTSRHRHVWLRKIVGRFAKLFGAHWFASRMNNIAKRTKFSKSFYVACSLPAHYGERETIERTYMSEPVYVDFENSRFAVMSGYDKYLRNLYGADYMKIPDGPRDGQHIDVWEVEFDVNK